ncbi:ATP-binding protein [Bacillus toyonensis]|uniref:AAA family ATPase n=1 Tax=Bacillus toyonensis TaxID=155322 RepID=UPI001C036408|nr:ATP-binding protein [Bacillus toyonensis]QWH88414.1 ATP-binding protein [Bacillus toyonensis]QWI31589.1 ATP-binding protein [Bacillus toyonensis]
MADLQQDKNSVHSEERYVNSLDHLRDELKRLDLLLQIQVMHELEQQSGSTLDEFMGLIISEEEIIRMIKELGNGISYESILKYENPKIRKLIKALDKLDSQIKLRRIASLQHGVYLALPHLSQMFQLTPFEERCILICLAPELDRKYEKVYSYLQDDVTRKNPTVELIIKLLCPTEKEMITARREFDSRAPLLKYSLLKITGNESEDFASLLSCSLKLDNRIVNFLLGFNEIDSQLESVAYLVPRTVEVKKNMLVTELQSQLKGFVQSYLDNFDSFSENLLFYFYGPLGSGKQELAEAACQDLGFPLIIVDVEKMLESELPFNRLMLVLGREAVLQPAALCFKNFDQLITDDNKYKSQLRFLLNWVREFSRLTFLLGSYSWNPLGLLRKQSFIDLEFSVPDECMRKKIWDSLQVHYQFSEEIDFGAISGKFRFTTGQIEASLKTARNLAHWRSPEDRLITEGDLYTACNSQSNQKLNILGKKVNSNYNWNDIVLPIVQINKLREIINQVKYRNVVYGHWGFNNKLSRGKGLNILFSGPPGTGKTMAAEVIANELKLHLYKIDLSQVVSKYIGETEKNLQRVFEEAQVSYSILFFDEADALFGKRSEVNKASDRHANIEIAYLLQKMEEYEGISILATNLYSNMDDAFVRRLQFNVTFPFPEAEYRERIWRSMFPDEAPKMNIDFAFLAKQFNIAGGYIKNIVLTAAFLAAEDSGVIEMKHIVRATNYELQKMGKLCSKDDFGHYSEYIR